MNDNPESTITALSPSDAEISRFLKSIEALLPGEKITKFRVPDLAQNDVSVAAWLQVGPLAVLLGADLEEHQSNNRGWSAVLSSSEKPSGRAQLFKVAHHGSITGHHDGIWADLLIQEPVAVLTPWNRGTKLPSNLDCQRILSFTPNAFATSAVPSSRSPKRDKAVEKTLAEAGIKVSPLEAPTGYIQIKTLIDSAEPEWNFELSDSACSLKDFEK